MRIKGWNELLGEKFNYFIKTLHQAGLSLRIGDGRTPKKVACEEYERKGTQIKVFQKTTVNMLLSKIQEKSPETE